jgi:hypothetical protein
VKAEPPEVRIRVGEFGMASSPELILLAGFEPSIVG